MKKIITTIVFILLISCAKEYKLELFSPEAFAYRLEKNWELNASLNVKGFKQIDTEDGYSCNLTYQVDLITPESDTIKQFDFDSIVEENDEEFLERTIEVQAVLDSNFSTGFYKLVFKVSDENSAQKASIEKTFELTED